MKILLSSAFTGDYVFDEENLPHEVINFFRADDGGFYVYVTPYGTMNPHMKTEDLKAILFIQRVGRSLVEVVAKAEADPNSSILYTAGVTLTSQHKFKSTVKKEEYKRKIEAADIRYGGIPIQDIHAGNKMDNGIYATMKVKSICFPKRTIYITNSLKVKAEDPNVIFVSSKQMANQSMKAYYEEFDGQNTAAVSGYTVLRQLVEDEEVWCSSEQTPKFDAAHIDSGDMNPNFFQVTRQQNNEVMFSNMFSYLFAKYPDLLKRFAREVLKVELAGDCKIEREKGRVDLKLTDDKHCIIIENKIKSLINGRTQKTDANGKFLSQLSRYYETAEREKGDRAVQAFLFRPNYSPIQLDGFSCGDKYTVITYQQIYDCFTKYESETRCDDLYLKEFIKAMKKHTKETDQEFRDRLMMRFAQRIEKQRRKGTAK